MLKLNLYIHGAGSIAPAAATTDQSTWKKEASEPDYTAWIPPMQLRRTSKVVRMGIGAAKLCLESARKERPDALSIGTAMGCLQDTEVFLNKMVSQEERMLTPTAFIQSTHNTVGGQIALLLGCHGHNMTYVHRGHSFEHALVNTKLYLQDHPGETVLAGGIDELTPTSHALMQQAGFYREDASMPGVAAGEGASFFLVNEQPGGALLRLHALHLWISSQPEEANAALADLLDGCGLKEDAIGVVVSGENDGDGNEAFYSGMKHRFAQAHHYRFKEICGEYATASAYALAQIAQGQYSGSQSQDHPYILLINHYCDHYSCWVLEQPFLDQR